MKKLCSEICSSKLTVFFELRSQKTVGFSEQITSVKNNRVSFRARWRLLLISTYDEVEDMFHTGSLVLFLVVEHRKTQDVRSMCSSIVSAWYTPFSFNATRFFYRSCRTTHPATIFGAKSLIPFECKECYCDCVSLRIVSNSIQEMLSAVFKLHLCVRQCWNK